MTERWRAAARAAADRVDQQRLWDRHMIMAGFGARADGGVDRQAFSAEDAASRTALAGWAAALGFGLFVDPITNLYVRRDGTDPQAAPVLAGSHMDSQPMGGRFDGIYGVLAAFEALQAIAEAGIRTRHPVEAVAWVNEEGSRFAPGLTGSSVFAGVEPLERALAFRDMDGVAIGDTLEAMRRATPAAIARPLGAPVAGYLEAHIEQGPVLEAEGVPIGVVTGIQGQRWFTVEVEGEAAHAGTTPVARRRDALAAALGMVHALQATMADPDDIVRFTVGRFAVEPGSPNTVPARVVFTIDLRHPDAGVLARLGDAVGSVCRDHAGPCRVTVTETQRNEPTVFQADAVRAVRSAAVALDLPFRDLPSGAGHDAKNLASLCPTAMIFVPCAKGISHNPAESATPEDLAAGARVLVHALVQMAGGDLPP